MVFESTDENPLVIVISHHLCRSWTFIPFTTRTFLSFFQLPQFIICHDHNRYD